ncbi:hypothetical protein Sjap_018836 [Stephania japonica]|uniref:Uncharacterized protein n=1 Tax=Stephania japonica TaxID=461633 RepID=A0AAP0I9H6_9MAGN
MEVEYGHVHGCILDELNLGLWMITPSNEFRNGGLNKRELASHVGPTTLPLCFWLITILVVEIWRSVMASHGKRLFDLFLCI